MGTRTVMSGQLAHPMKGIKENLMVGKKIDVGTLASASSDSFNVKATASNCKRLEDGASDAWISSVEKRTGTKIMIEFEGQKQCQDDDENEAYVEEDEAREEEENEENEGDEDENEEKEEYEESAHEPAADIQAKMTEKRKIKIKIDGGPTSRKALAKELMNKWCSNSQELNEPTF